MHRGKSSDTNRKIPEKPWKRTRKKPTAGLILKAPSSIRKINIIRIDKGGHRGGGCSCSPSRLSSSRFILSAHCLFLSTTARLNWAGCKINIFSFLCLTKSLSPFILIWLESNFPHMSFNFQTEQSLLKMQSLQQASYLSVKIQLHSV